MKKGETPSDRRRARGARAAALVVLLPAVVVGQGQSSGRSTGTARQHEEQSLWKAESAYRKAVAEADKNELVLPAPRDFSPVPKAAPSLVLKLKSTAVKAGAPLSYSLTLVNSSASPIRIRDRRAFFKLPNLTSTIQWRFWVTPSVGDRFELVYGDTAELAGLRTRRLPQTAGEQAASVGDVTPAGSARRAWEADAEGSLDVLLLPGESLQSRACAASTREFNPALRVGPGFCDFPSDQMPRTPGRYKLMVEMSDLIPDAASHAKELSGGASKSRYLADFRREHAHHLGLVLSNVVEFEVIP